MWLVWYLLVMASVSLAVLFFLPLAYAFMVDGYVGESLSYLAASLVTIPVVAMANMYRKVRAVSNN